MLVLLIQPVGVAFAMTQAVADGRHAHMFAGVEPQSSQAERHHHHQGADQASQIQKAGKASSDSSTDNCCSTAACCPAALINTGIPISFAVSVSPEEFHFSSHTITPGIEIRPPRQALSS